MNHWCPVRRVALAALFGLSLVPSTWAGTLSVMPVRVSVPADGQAQTMTVENRGDQTVLVKLEARQWTASGDMNGAVGSSELLAVPPMFELGPEQTQVVRLALRRPLASPAERTYRLFITEVPKAVNTSGAGLALAARMNLPVFVTPPAARPEPVWSVRSAVGGSELVLDNRGTAHLRVHAVELIVADQAEPLFGSKGVTYALAGDRARWPLEKPLSALPERLEVRAQTNRGPLVAPVARQGG